MKANRESFKEAVLKLAIEGMPRVTWSRLWARMASSPEPPPQLISPPSGARPGSVRSSF